MEPNLSRLIEMLFSLFVVFHTLWVLYFNFCVRLLLGTDLDRDLREKRMAWSVLDIRLVHVLLTRCAHGGVGGVKTIFSGDDDGRQKPPEKYLYLSMTVEQLNTEIALLRTSILDKRVEVDFIENFKYTLDENLWTAFSVKVPKV